MRKIFITKKQADILNESILEDGFNIPEHLSNDMARNNTPFSNIGIDATVLDKMLKERFQEVNSIFNDDMDKIPLSEVSKEMSKLLVICMKKEEPIKEQLEKLCFNTLLDVFEIPDGEVDFNCTLENVSGEQQFHITPDTNEEKEYEDMSEFDTEEQEVNKRRIINALVAGGASYIMEKIRKYYISELFDLDEDLPHLYSKIMKLNDYLLFRTNVKITDKNHCQSGFVKVILGNDINKSKIEAHGSIFPILLNETLKGVLELFASHGLPKQLDIAKTIINKADILVSDPWNMRFGPVFWKRVFDDVDIELIPETFTFLVKAPSKEFLSAFREIMYGTRLGNELKYRMKAIAKREKEYNNFEGDLMQKEDDKCVISDSYFSPEELAM